MTYIIHTYFNGTKYFIICIANASFIIKLCLYLLNLVNTNWLFFLINYKFIKFNINWLCFLMNYICMHFRKDSSYGLNLVQV